MTDADKTRIEIEKEAIDYVIKETGYQVLPEHDHWKNAYIAGATVWAEQLKQERNKAIDTALSEFVEWSSNVNGLSYIDRLESLKSKPE